MRNVFVLNGKDDTSDSHKSRRKQHYMIKMIRQMERPNTI